MLDLAARPKDSGSLHSVATIVGELAGDGRLDGGKVAELASRYPLAVVRRLGWLLDRVAFAADTASIAEPLHEYVAERSASGRRAVDLLAAGGMRRGKTNTRWGLVENVEVEPDL